MHPDWHSDETAASRDGPYADALLFRSVTYGMMIVFSLIGRRR